MLNNAGDARTADVKCRHCGEHNSLTVSDIPRDATIACSHCGKNMGVWGTLAEPAPEDGGEEATSSEPALPK